MKITVRVKPWSKYESIEWQEKIPLLRGVTTGRDGVGKNGDEKVRTEREGWEKTLILKTRARPVDGEANSALIKALSEFFKVPKSRITIVRWHTSREKVVEIEK